MTCSYLKPSKVILAIVVKWIVGDERRLLVTWGRRAVMDMEEKGWTRIY